jgi:hypothetical protein
MLLDQHSRACASLALYDYSSNGTDVHTRRRLERGPGEGGKEFSGAELQAVE